MTEPKVVKNRVHLDIAAGAGRDARARELEAAGGTELARVEEQGGMWIVMADPEGNEFCVTGTDAAGGPDATDA